MLPSVKPIKIFFTLNERVARFEIGIAFFAPNSSFLETFKSFCGKEIVFSAVDKVIHLHYGDNVLNLENLSSGEKQLFILLAEVLLKNRQHVVSITDEPELSLHISWQQKILPALHKLNPACQIIIATHSPEIAGSYPDQIILMEDILS